MPAFDTSENLSWWERADAGGRYTLRVAAGKVRIECRRDHSLPSSRNVVVDLAPGARAVADVEVFVVADSPLWPVSPVELDEENRVQRATEPAKVAGIDFDDVVVAVDGIDLTGFPRWVVSSLLLHGSGSSARITIQRDGFRR